ncbi:hypothetical protein PHLCEN_2v12833 [Hermanssonia centrifuga]|uniref:Uncharacterized protein n=1 Tax=Hermanssonia centrifuga TaxID=98765 RepID=A0A2R6NG79_9APHY|nr:hypothetical protein PHLCEN_2v12833 [Hermanssonia centrifuga]
MSELGIIEDLAGSVSHEDPAATFTKIAVEICCEIFYYPNRNRAPEHLNPERPPVWIPSPLLTTIPASDNQALAELGRQLLKLMKNSTTFNTPQTQGQPTGGTSPTVTTLGV